MITESCRTRGNTPRVTRLELKAETFAEERFLAVLAEAIRTGGAASATPLLPVGVFGVETVVDFEEARK